MTKIKFVFLTLFSAIYLASCNLKVSEVQPLTNSITKDKKPNILLIVVDDLGFTDLGSFGGDDIATPNLDKLANQGMRLSNFYTAPTCSPTRSMLLTGVDNHLAGVGAMAEAMRGNLKLKGRKGYEGYLTDRAASLPEVLKSAGYNTYMAGKWHLGMKDDQSPTARGFDKTFTLLNGGAGHFDDLGLSPSPSVFRENGKITNLPDNFYSTEFYTRKIQEYLAMNKGTDKPFFAYLAYTAPHWPLQALPETIELYRGKYDAGYDELHKARIQSGIKAGVVASNSPASVPGISLTPPWSDLDDGEKRSEARQMEIYAAMIHDLDVYIGQLIETLKEQGEIDNTVIFFMSDNGADGSDFDSAAKLLVPYVKKCCNNEFENMGKADSYLFAGPAWARASVGASKLFKNTTAEGGIKAPAFIIYPGMNESATISKRFMTVKDVMPTMLEFAGIKKPQGMFNGRQVLPIEGKSLFEEQDENTVEMGWELHGNKAVRYGYWKIVNMGGMLGDGTWKLYNLKSDPSEQHDLAEKNPDKLKEMIARWEQYAKDKWIVSDAEYNF